MKRRYLGDSLDLAKRVVLATLPAEQRTSFAVIPMCSDPEEWKPADRETYRRLLGLPAATPILWQPGSDAERLGPLPHGTSAIFLDPDTGIRRVADPRHVGVWEIEQLLRSSESRVVIAYQHRWRNNGFVQQILDWFPARPSVAYDAGAVTFVFVANDGSLLNKCREALEAMLGSASDRVISPAGLGTEHLAGELVGAREPRIEQSERQGKDGPAGRWTARLRKWRLAIARCACVLWGHKWIFSRDHFAPIVCRRCGVSLREARSS